MLWRRKTGKEPARGLPTDPGSGSSEGDVEDETEDMAPAEKAKLVALVARHAQLQRDGRWDITFDACIERIDEDGNVMESMPVRTPAVPLPPTGLPVDIGADLQAGRVLGVDGFVALDFETATRSRASACAVAIAVVDDGKVQDIHRWLIQPPGNEYEGFNVSIHGITPAMTAASPSITEVWPEVSDVIGGRPLVAHYAAFDMSVLRQSLTEAGSPWPSMTYFCTRAMAKRAWPGMLSYSLIDLADECGITFEHHEAGADAATSAELAIAFCGHASQRHLADASKALRLMARILTSDSWRPSGLSPSRLDDLTPTVSDVAEDGPFYGKTIVFTGTLSSGLTRAEAAQYVVNAGGRATNSMSKKVDFLILGQQDSYRLRDGVHSGKMLKAAELQASGTPIEVISEDTFLRMLPA